MKRRRFFRRILAYLGVGVVVSVGKPSLAEETPLPSHLPPPLILTHGTSLEGRLRRMIERDRGHGFTVNWFHTNRATLNALWEEIGLRWDPLPTQTVVYEGVQWWGCEEMVEGEILLSDEGIMPECPRCGGSGEIPAKGSKGDMSPWMGHRADGIIPAGPEIDAYHWIACPRCLGTGENGETRWKPVRVGSKSYVVDQRLADLWGVPLGEEF